MAVFPDSVNQFPDCNRPEKTCLLVSHQNKDMPKQYVAVNYIQCNADYRERFEQLFATRAHAIDTMPGFIDMHVLRPSKEGDSYLIVSYWDNEEAFKSWTSSPAFIEGHKRGFADIAKAREEGRPAPMSSDFKTYTIIAN
jgi:heme-degrading monooxygenase HmoA